MSSRKLLVRVAVFPVSALAFTGCVPMATAPTSVQDMNKDRIGYLNQNFDPSNLPPAALSSIRKDAATPKFKKIVLSTENAFEKSNGTKETSHSTITLINKGNGFIQEMSENSNNDITFSVSFELSYKDLIWLKRQSFWLANRAGSPPIEVKSITSFPHFDTAPTENSDYSLEFSFGTPQQLGSFIDKKAVYHTGTYYAASQLSPKLEGRAIDLTIEDSAKGVVSSKSKWAYIADFGIAIDMESATSTQKTTHKILDIKIEQ